MFNLNFSYKIKKIKLFFVHSFLFLIIPQTILGSPTHSREEERDKASPPKKIKPNPPIYDHIYPKYINELNNERENIENFSMPKRNNKTLQKNNISKKEINSPTPFKKSPNPKNIKSSEKSFFVEHSTLTSNIKPSIVKPSIVKKIIFSSNSNNVETKSNKKISPVQAFVNISKQYNTPKKEIIFKNPETTNSKSTLEYTEKDILEKFTHSSRSWRNDFSTTTILNEKEEEVKKWHTEKASVLNKIKNIYDNFIKELKDSKIVYSKERYRNFALAEIKWFKEDDVKTVPLEYIFISGWPSNETLEKKIHQKFKELISQHQDKEIKFLENYSIDALTTINGANKKNRIEDSSGFSKNLEEVFKNCCDNTNGCHHSNHTRFLSKINYKNLSTHYFHTEQSIRLLTKSLLENVNKENHQFTNGVIDISSYRDMCGCCGDSLYSDLHNSEKNGLKISIRCSGVIEYSELNYIQNVLNIAGWQKELYLRDKVEIFSLPKRNIQEASKEIFNYKDVIKLIVWN